MRSAAALRVAQKDQAKAFLTESIAEYRKADAIKPEQAGIQMQLARALTVMGDSAGAEQLYLHLIEKHKTLDYAYTELYRLYMQTGKPEEGEKALKMGFQGDPKQFGFLTMLAAHYYNQKRGQRDDRSAPADQGARERLPRRLPGRQEIFIFGWAEAMTTPFGSTAKASPKIPTRNRLTRNASSKPSCGRASARKPPK